MHPASTSTASAMPAEWAPHERTWMAFPPSNDTFGDPGSGTLARARRAWSAVARTISRYEPVTVLADPADVAQAHELLGDGITVLPVPLDDAWLRDSGPTFVHAADGSVAAVDWIFNGWGAQDWAAWDKDQHLGRFTAGRAGVPVHASTLVNEGGGFHTDGEGTVLLTETVQLDPGRNPGATRESVEAEIHARLGTSKAIWLPRGLTRDYDEFGTRGHVDIVACFASPGTVLLHRQDDSRHPDHDVTQEIRAVLEAATDARGRTLELIDVPAPTVIDAGDGFVDYSYINHYVANNVVVLCAFDDANDAAAADILGRAYPGRTIELVDARDIFEFGGGIHCITQQQPAPLGCIPKAGAAADASAAKAGAAEAGA
ncbi:agmatine deiminase family protein [Arthrobacter caoxuetaonis]|uniref:agmatine deiminase family protein n=1 Tax=Arthrobacter caoxuetaonis TaxID=2886935 RepID=UPI001D14F320|nr:agmatine deiminase family protein [Arthrobacter caoxuetaonis]MCC3282091.1 agmatine deiminase family protein [Arthrobacter caoxuetaonis]